MFAYGKGTLGELKQSIKILQWFNFRLYKERHADIEQQCLPQQIVTPIHDLRVSQGGVKESDGKAMVRLLSFGFYDPKVNFDKILRDHGIAIGWPILSKL